MQYRKLIVLLSFISFLCGCGGGNKKPPPQPQHPRPAGFWKNKEAVVQVAYIFSRLAKDKKTGQFILDKQGRFTTELDNILGTGGVTDVNGEVMTNYHVIKDRPITLTPDDPTPFPAILLSAPPPPNIVAVCTNVGNALSHCYTAEIVKTDRSWDLAILHVNHKFPRAIEFADDSGLVPGDELYFWGNVFDILPPSPIFGRYIGHPGKPYYEGINEDRLIMDITIVPASSGSPVFDYAGRSIGFVSAYTPKIPGPRPVGVIIPSSEATRFKKANPYHPPKK